MINVLSGLKLGKGRTATTWEEVLQTFQPREWSMIPTKQGRMAFAVVEGDLENGRMLALVMMQDTVSPSVFMPTGSMLFTIRGKLHVVEQGREVLMEAWDLVHLDNALRQEPWCEGLYLGLWGFPAGNPLLRMVQTGARERHER